MSGLPMAICRWTFSISTVASSTRIPTASARPPSTQTTPRPGVLRQVSETSTLSGMDSAMMMVLRHEPMKSRIMTAVSAAAMVPSLSTPLMAARTKSDWSANSLTWRSVVTVVSTWGNWSFTRFTTSRVEAMPLFMMVRSVPRWPFMRTMLVCGLKPSRT